VSATAPLACAIAASQSSDCAMGTVSPGASTAAFGLPGVTSNTLSQCTELALGVAADLLADVFIDDQSESQVARGIAIHREELDFRHRRAG
jgi:hypothetical protein